MRLLIDTQVLIWTLEGDPRVQDRWRRAMAAAEEVHVSAATIWEIAIKRALGKLRPSRDPGQVARSLGFLPLAVTWEHGEAVATLPLHHGDPFDRLLIAQARVEGLTLVTSDRVFALYDVALL